MNDSEESPEAESIHRGGLFYVPSQPEVIPISSSMLIRDRSMSLSTWNPPGLKKKIWGNQFPWFDSPGCYRTRNTKRGWINLRTGATSAAMERNRCRGFTAEGTTHHSRSLEKIFICSPNHWEEGSWSAVTPGVFVERTVKHAGRGPNACWRAVSGGCTTGRGWYKNQLCTGWRSWDVRSQGSWSDGHTEEEQRRMSYQVTIPKKFALDIEEDSTRHLWGCRKVPSEGPYVTRYNWLKNPQNCQETFSCLGSLLTKRWRTYDYKDSLSGIPCSSLDTQTSSHDVPLTGWLGHQQVSEKKATRVVANGPWQSLTSEQDNRG